MPQSVFLATNRPIIVEQDEEEAARLAEVGAGRVTGAAAPVNRKLRDRQTVFASATVPQHNHFIRQCVQVRRYLP